MSETTSVARSVAILSNTIPATPLTCVVAVGAPFENSNARGIGGNADDNSAHDAGAVYVYPILQAADIGAPTYVKALNTDGGDAFGSAVALTPEVLYVGAPAEDSAATSWDATSQGNGARDAGAVYAYR